MLIESKGFEGVYMSGGGDVRGPGSARPRADLADEVGRPRCSRSPGSPPAVARRRGRRVRGADERGARYAGRSRTPGWPGCTSRTRPTPSAAAPGRQARRGTESAARRIQAAVAARRDANLLIIARTDAPRHRGIDAAIARAKGFVDAGADAIFPEAMADLRQNSAAVRAAVEVSSLANMTEWQE